MAEQLKEEEWDEIIKRIEEEKCILIRTGYRIGRETNNE